MKCTECYWSAVNAATGTDRVCCNKNSPCYNKIVSKDEAERTGCDEGESQRAVDYRTLNPWEFARKYYM